MRYSVKYIVIAVLLLAFVACNNKNRRDETPIATLGDKSLYMSDIAEIFPQGGSVEDSVKLLNDYINKWARKQLILKKAENNLSTSEKDVTAELEDYRASLLIFRYEQAYVAQRMDTVVSNEELQAFYEANSNNFQLVSPLLKALYIKIPNNAPALKRIREIYRSTSDKTMRELESLCYQGAVKFDSFNDEWIDFAMLAKELPLNARSYENDLITKRYIEESDTQFTYLISARDLKVKGVIAPFEHVKSNIRSIILNKRKLDLVKSLEDNIYNEAVNRSELKVNTPN